MAFSKVIYLDIYDKLEGCRPMPKTALSMFLQSAVPAPKGNDKSDCGTRQCRKEIVCVARQRKAMTVEPAKDIFVMSFPSDLTIYYLVHILLIWYKKNAAP